MMSLRPCHWTKVADHSAQMKSWQQRSEHILDRCLPAETIAPEPLHQAMRYSALASGKRFRPVLVYAVGEALGLEHEYCDPIATSIELIHAYSLIHDDLPAMDDDDLRRGRPTCHKAFDEATAILAGDALQALAFEVLASAENVEPQRMLRAISELAKACGSTGMAGGQAVDLAAVGKKLSADELNHMHSLKTGALIRACVRAPCLVAGVEQDILQELTEYADAVGLAFQVHDDILDVTGNSQVIGKSAHSDHEKNKPTYPSILGMEESLRQAEHLHQKALAHLKQVSLETSSLAWLAGFVVSRDR